MLGWLELVPFFEAPRTGPAIAATDDNNAKPRTCRSGNSMIHTASWYRGLELAGEMQFSRAGADC